MSEVAPGQRVLIVGASLGQCSDDPEEQPFLGQVATIWYPRGGHWWVVRFADGGTLTYERQAFMVIQNSESEASAR